MVFDILINLYFRRNLDNIIMSNLIYLKSYATFCSVLLILSDTVMRSQDIIQKEELKRDIEKAESAYKAHQAMLAKAKCDLNKRIKEYDKVCKQFFAIFPSVPRLFYTVCTLQYI